MGEHNETGVRIHPFGGAAAASQCAGTWLGLGAHCHLNTVPPSSSCADVTSQSCISLPLLPHKLCP